jgi:hypothetical protein
MVVLSCAFRGLAVFFSLFFSLPLSTKLWLAAHIILQYFHFLGFSFQFRFQVRDEASPCSPSPRASAKSQRRIRLTLSASLYWDPQRPFPLSVRPPQRMMPRNARFVIVDLHNDVVAAAGCLTGLYRYYSPGSSWVQTVGPLFPEEGPVMNWRRSADSLMERTIEDRGGCCVFCVVRCVSSSRGDCTGMIDVRFGPKSHLLERISKRNARVMMCESVTVVR